MADEKLIGKVTHYFTNIGVAVIEITNGKLKVGDTLRIKGATSDFEQSVDSMQVEHENVEKAKKGESVGLKVDQQAREGDEVSVVG
ncbi:MAG: EF-Tu/IF-2/RF-3 family GTPase [Candidatus Portnoybacteria bacterium]